LRLVCSAVCGPKKKLNKKKKVGENEEEATSDRESFKHCGVKFHTDCNKHSTFQAAQATIKRIKLEVERRERPEKRRPLHWNKINQTDGLRMRARRMWMCW